MDSKYISLSRLTKNEVRYLLKYGLRFLFLEEDVGKLQYHNSQSIMNSEPNQSARVLFGPAMRTAHQVGFPLVLIMINLD